MNGLKFGMLMYIDHLQNLISLWSWSVDFPHFGGILTQFLCIFGRTHGKNVLKFDRLIFPEYLQN